ncbi:MAG: hypothetical protein IJX62_02215 [Clostridia bacterium]|nr:hypothetical protein [Clostridia bacterium]
MVELLLTQYGKRGTEDILNGYLVERPVCVRLSEQLSKEQKEEVLSNWEALKTEEKKRNTLVDRLRAIPPMLPALMRASKVGKKAEMYEQEDKEAVLDALETQIAALRNNPDDSFEKIGDLLMTATHLSRKYGVDAEEALSRATDRIIDGLEQKQ